MNDSVATWIDKLAITEIVHRFARAIDRCDEPLLREVFHPGATDDHGTFSGTAEAFVAWVLPVLEAMERTQHTIGNVLVEVDGDRAFAESYFHAWHRLLEEGAEIDMVAAGRYLDRFERRGGTWGIVHRHAVYDWTEKRPAADAHWRTGPLAERLERGARGVADASYRDRDAFLG